MRLLLVEDDVMIGEGVRKGLRHEGLAVDWVEDGRAADAAIHSDVYEVVLLDLGLPGKQGLEILRAMRRRGNTTPVLILTARDALSDRVSGLDAGADDYVVKPFDLEELAARIRALARRRAGRAEPVMRAGTLALDPATHEVTLGDESVALSAREFSLLKALLERAGTVLSRAQLEERLYGWGEEVGSNAVEVYIHSLRKKLGVEVIKNVRGVGYMVSPPS